MPATAEALASGEVSETAVGLLLSARDAAPEQFAEAEETLVEAGRVLSVGELKRGSTTGVSPPTQSGPPTTRNVVSNAAISTFPPPSTAWCGSTATWIPRPDRR
jgi:hypothetical protein